MYGAGGMLGPDLTGSNRANREYILLNIVDPNFDVPDGYKMVVLKTKNDRVLAGTIGEEDSQKVILKTVSGKEIIPKDNIKERQKLPLSMMPEGILETIPIEDFFALIKYLQTEEQTEKSKK
jgi:putative heme-binding domain-containing protein